jgi:hypothetical protein
MKSAEDYCTDAPISVQEYVPDLRSILNSYTHVAAKAMAFYDSFISQNIVRPNRKRSYLINIGNKNWAKPDQLGFKDQGCVRFGDEVERNVMVSFY